MSTIKVDVVKDKSSAGLNIQGEATLGTDVKTNIVGTKDSKRAGSRGVTVVSGDVVTSGSAYLGLGDTDSWLKPGIMDQLSLFVSGTAGRMFGNFNPATQNYACIGGDLALSGALRGTMKVEGAPGEFMYDLVTHGATAQHFANSFEFKGQHHVWEGAPPMDTNFFVSGTMNSKNSTSPGSSGTAMFSGDLVVSGNTYLEKRVITTYGDSNFPAPPFVPGFQEGIGVDVLDNHTVMHEAIFGDIGSNTNIWEYDTDNSAAVACAVGTDITHGGFTLATGGTDGHQTAIATAAKNYMCSPGKPWWVKTRFNLDDHDAVEFFFGLTERAADVDSWHLTAPGGGADRAGFVKAVHDNDAITYAATKDGGGTITSPLSAAQLYDADLSVLSLGIYWDGFDSIRFYADKVSTTTKPSKMTLVHKYNTSAGISDQPMRLCLLIETGASSVRTARIEYIKGAYTK